MIVGFDVLDASRVMIQEALDGILMRGDRLRRSTDEKGRHAARDARLGIADIVEPVSSDRRALPASRRCRQLLQESREGRHHIASRLLLLQ